MKGLYYIVQPQLNNDEFLVFEEVHDTDSDAEDRVVTVTSGQPGQQQLGGFY